MTKPSESFAVLMSVYAKEKPEYLEQSLSSIFNQTLLPNEIVLVKDGQLPQKLEEVILKFSKINAGLLNVVGYDVNKGLGEALNFGLQFCRSVIVLRMDADDICVADRFEKQMSFFARHPETDVLGSNISEFIGDPGKPLRIKKVPEHNEDIRVRGAIMNPMNHMTVGFRKEKVLAVGGYRHAPYFEDYDLWARMLHANMHFHNLQESLVLARVGNDMIGKRHGWQYFLHEWNHFKTMHDTGFINKLALFKAAFLRMPLRLIPKPLLAAFYNFALRKNYE